MKIVSSDIYTNQIGVSFVTHQVHHSIEKLPKVNHSWFNELLLTLFLFIKVWQNNTQILRVYKLK